jgi:hypothetical protein
MQVASRLIDMGACLIPYAAAYRQLQVASGHVGGQRHYYPSVVSARIGAQVISRVHLRAWHEHGDVS